ncbi:hypothetical protein K438DRAFT_1771947 [Mycena galopus ATCC 62051]|nr:hypothetical protein K438DRAFT_1771947 [Mycena galopus ATCC 62051]
MSSSVISAVSSGSLPALPTAVPVTVKRAAHVKRRNALPATKIPEGYAFLPPSVPLTYPPTYRPIDAGPMHEAPKLMRKRTVFGALTNMAGRMKSLTSTVELQATVPRDAVGTRLAGYEGMVAGFGFAFEPGPFQQSDGEYGGEAGSLVGPPPHLWTSVDGGEAGSLVGKISSFFVSVNRADPSRYRLLQLVWESR